MIVGCSCGKCKIEKEWDEFLDTYYYYFKCEKCEYYWEGVLSYYV